MGRDRVAIPALTPAGRSLECRRPARVPECLGRSKVKAGRSGRLSAPHSTGVETHRIVYLQHGMEADAPGPALSPTAGPHRNAAHGGKLGPDVTTTAR
ncbi:hypothetical protein NDU88_002755 [Pleurodeles waltl]|uniref:Uncharacterized protein n=1 Tax=Pleurodeles waltl TaxID=8319 RepID=A0AAV7UBY9_PLEWA|nr:hypothetical protein NDU88_002755 [Pleurodeles waltl]